MSIWCSWDHIGTDPRVMHHVKRDGTRGRKVKQRPERGNVLSYAEGFGNHYPNLDGTHERPAVLALAHIPSWCAAGHDMRGEGYVCTGCGEYHDDTAYGGWLRLEVEAPETLSFWRRDDDGKPEVIREGATVVLDEEAARSLRDDLTEWLDRPKVRPLL